MIILKLLARLIIVVGCLTFAFSAIVLFGSAVAKVDNTDLGSESRWIVLALVAAFVCIAIGLFFLAGISSRFILSPPNRLRLPDSNLEAGFSQEQIDEVDRLTLLFPAQQRVNLMSLAMEHWKYVDRSVEEIDLSDTRLGRQVTRALDLASLAQEGRSQRHVYVPVHRHRKGVLVDRLDVRVGDQAVDTLPYKMNMAMNVLVFREFWAAVSPMQGVADATAISKLSRYICSPRASSHRKEYSDQLAEVRASWEKGNSDRKLTDNQEAAFRFLQYLSDYFILWAKVPTRRAMQVSLEVSSSERRIRLYKGISNRIRQVLGVPIFQYYVALTEPLEAGSYHFRADAPDGTYLYSANVLGSLKRTKADHQASLTERLNPAPPEISRQDVRQLVSTEVERAAAPMAVVAPNFGTSYVHVYTRDLHHVLSGPLTASNSSVRSRVFGLWLHLVFRPIPPGLSGLAVIIASYLLILTTTVAAFHDRVFGTGSAGVPGAITVLAALPAVMSAWIVSRFAGSGIRAATPILIFEIMSLMAISLLTAGVATFKAANKVKDPSSHFPVFHSIHGHPWWTLVWALTAAQFLVSVICLGTRLGQYFRAQARSRALVRRNSL